MIACARTPHPALVAAWSASPELRATSLVLGGHLDERGTVIAASDQARAQGVCVGMSLNQAQQLAPQSNFQPVDEEGTARVHQLLLSTLHQLTPDVAADQDPGCAFLQLDRLSLRWPDQKKLLIAISRQLENALDVSAAIGVGCSMFVARVAADRASPGSPLIVETNETSRFLARLPIDVLPLDDDLREYLELLGLRTIGSLQTISRTAFRQQLGVKALDVYDLAFGIDHRRWQAFKPPVRIQAAEPLEPPIDNTEALQFIARALAERISSSLLRHGLGTRALRITLQQESTAAIAIDVRFAYPVSTTSELFDGIRPRLLRATINAPLERITLRAGRLEPAYVRQPGLLIRRDGFTESIADAVARLHEEYGPSLVQRAEVQPEAAPIPDHRILWKPA
ncbi:MAG TPA: DNA polymerase Y family protein [Candidatus Dormibacteraeota bacterium]